MRFKRMSIRWKHGWPTTDATSGTNCSEHRKKWNWQNWMRESEQYGTASDPEIDRALAEGWGWLMTHGLVIRDSKQSSTDAYRVSRLGEETLKYGIAKLAAAERLGLALHPRLAN